MLGDSCSGIPPLSLERVSTVTLFILKTVPSVLFSIRERTFLASIALRMHLWLLWTLLSYSAVFQFRSFGFWTVSALLIFNRMLASLSACVHSHEIRLLWCLVDWLSLPSSERNISHIFLPLLSSCHSLGFVMADC